MRGPFSRIKVIASLFLSSRSHSLLILKIKINRLEIFLQTFSSVVFKINGLYLLSFVNCFPSEHLETSSKIGSSQDRSLVILIKVLMEMLGLFIMVSENKGKKE